MTLKKFDEFVNEEQKNYRIFQDMDGCLTNFTKSFQAIPENDKHLTMEDYYEALGVTAAWKLVEPYGIDFWSKMEWMPDGKKLWDYVSKYPNTTILSSPSRDKNCYLGKIKWCKENLGIGGELTDVVLNDIDWDPSKTKIILNSQKHKFCKDPNWILIDDSEDKIKKWIDAGGIGILHTSANKTIEELRELGV